MKEFTWIRIEDNFESLVEYANTVPTFNACFGQREHFTYTMKNLSADEWNDIVREKRRFKFPDKLVYHFIEAFYAREVLSQPTHMSKVFQVITKILDDEPLSGTTGI